MGSPIHPCGTDYALETRREQLRNILPRLYKLIPHEALFLLRSSFAVPRLLYILRTSLCSTSSETTRLNEVIRETLESICNVRLVADTWAQASFPARWGGIGVRSTVDLAPSAFLSALHASTSIMHTLLPPRALQSPDPTLEGASLGGRNLVGPPYQRGQKSALRGLGTTAYALSRQTVC